MSFSEIFSARLWDFGLPTLRSSLLSAKEFIKEVGMETIAAVCQSHVLFNRDMLEASDEPEEVFENASIHEMGHPYLVYSAPGTFRNKLDDGKEVSKLLGDKKFISVWHLLNITYDMIIDILSYDRVDYNPIPILKTFDKINPSTPTSYVGQSLIAFREEMMNDRFSGHDIEEIVRIACRKIIVIVRDPATAELPRKRVLDISRILVELYTSQPEQDDDDGGDDEGEGNDGDGESEGEPKDGEPSNGKPKKGKQKGASKSKPKKGKSGNLTEEELQELAEKLKEVIEEMGLGEATTQEDQSDDPTEAKIKATDLEDKADRDAAKNALKLSEDEAAFEMLWSAAEERVRLQTPLCGVGEGTAFPAGSVPWAPGMPLRELNVESTLLNGGIFIPGVTSVQDYIVPGPGMPVEGRFPRVCVSCDTSGSMRKQSPIRNNHNLDLCLTSIYAMFHEARRRRVPIFGNLFADENYSSKEGWTTNYKSVARELYQYQDHPGGGNSCTGTDGKVGELLRPGDMLIYITDFELCGSESLAAKQLQKFVQDGINVVFIAMFHHCAQQAGIPFVECKELKDLENVALHSFQ